MQDIPQLFNNSLRNFRMILSAILGNLFPAHLSCRHSKHCLSVLDTESIWNLLTKDNFSIRSIPMIRGFWIESRMTGADEEICFLPLSFSLDRKGKQNLRKPNAEPNGSLSSAEAKQIHRKITVKTRQWACRTAFPNAVEMRAWRQRQLVAYDFRADFSCFSTTDGGPS